MAMSNTLKIRMYNVGFGDSFLIELPEKRTILVDAGFHSQGKGAFGGNELAEQIIGDAKAISGRARIDVIIATHRHQDHITVFNSDKWAELEVGEVWMPWVEDRTNKKAMALWKKQEKFARQLAAAVPSFGLGADDLASVQFMLWNAGVEIPALADAGGWSNARALDCLHEGFARRDRARPRFLPEKAVCPETFESTLLPGVRIHVLGPPNDPALIEDLDPEADGETYRALALRAAASAAPGVGASVPVPFGAPWQVPPTEPGWFLDSAESERIRDLAQSADAVFAAEKVDGMINSTSLVLVVEIGRARLLLPGDAEWGTWKRILASDEARALLRSASFLKVGHHGSHNATSKTLVEKILPRKIPAMISTQEGPGNYRHNIPLQDLLTALQAREIQYVRSDRDEEPLPEGFERMADQRWTDLTLVC
ncbi:MAG: ComEC family competence protein [Gammaproteobacteria bacterium]|nr:ComEC family competence protein [Gammaproteobacteria bacterium]